MYECLKCGSDMDDIVGFDHLCDDFVLCPKCGHKMTIEYDESYDAESGDESYWFWLEEYKEA